MQCNAHAKSTGEKCTRKAMANGKCYVHGGATPKGIASPHIKTGRYSKYLPKALDEQYNRSVSDTELLSIREDIALVDAMISSALPKLETRESGKAWQLIKKSITEMKAAFVDEQYGKAMAYLDVMVEIVNNEMLYYATEEEIRAALEQRRKLTETERKRLTEMEQTITSEQAVLLMTALLDSVKRNVTDPTALTAIQADFIRYARIQNSERTQQPELAEVS